MVSRILTKYTGFLGQRQSYFTHSAVISTNIIICTLIDAEFHGVIQKDLVDTCQYKLHEWNLELRKPEYFIIGTKPSLFALEEDIVTITQGYRQTCCLLRRETLATGSRVICCTNIREKIVQNKGQSVSHSQDMQKYQRPVENCSQINGNSRIFHVTRES